MKWPFHGVADLHKDLEDFWTSSELCACANSLADSLAKDSAWRESLFTGWR